MKVLREKQLSLMQSDLQAAIRCLDSSNENEKKARVHLIAALSFLTKEVSVE
jgi:hypothetical protein